MDLANVIRHYKCNDMVYAVSIPYDANMFKQYMIYRSNCIIVNNFPVRVDEFVTKNADFFVEHSGGLALKFVENQSNELCMKAVGINGFALEYVKNKTYDVCMKALDICGMALKYIDNQMYSMCMKAVQANGMTLQYVKCKTQKICDTAVEQNWMALQYVPEEMQTNEMCLTAVCKNWHALQFVSKNNKTYKICYKALCQNPISIKHAGVFREYLETGLVIFVGIIFLVGLEKTLVQNQRIL